MQDVRVYLDLCVYQEDKTEIFEKLALQYATIFCPRKKESLFVRKKKHLLKK